MKKLLLMVGTVLLLWIPGNVLYAQDEVSRETAIELIQSPLNGEILSDEDAEALLSEWEAATLENGTIGTDDSWIITDYLPEGLHLEHETQRDILLYLNSLVAEESEAEETVEEEFVDPLEDYPEYRTIVNDYYMAIENNDPAVFPDHVNPKAVEDARDLNLDAILMVHYGLLDLDGNGVEELILFNYNQVFEVFTTDLEAEERVAIPLFQDESLAERSHLTLYEDSSKMLVRASGGAKYAEWTLFDMAEDGLVIEVVDTMIFDEANSPTDTPFYREQEPEVYYTHDEMLESFGLNDLSELNLSAIDTYPVMSIETLEEILAQEEGDDSLPYAVYFDSLGESMSFYMAESPNAPSQIDLDLVNGTLTTSFNGENVNVYSVSFDYVAETDVRVFSANAPGDIRTITANSAITIYEILEGSQAEVVGQTFYLFYNLDGGISLATPNFAGNVEPDQADVMLEYLN